MAFFEIDIELISEIPINKFSKEYFTYMDLHLELVPGRKRCTAASSHTNTPSEIEKPLSYSISTGHDIQIALPDCNGVPDCNDVQQQALIPIHHPK